MSLLNKLLKKIFDYNFNFTSEISGFQNLLINEMVDIFFKTRKAFLIK